MINRIFAFSIITVVVALALALPSTSGTKNPCFSYTMWWWGDPWPTGCFPYAPGEGPFSWLFACPSAQCAPAAASTETCPTCPKGGRPISLSNGNTFITEVDVQNPGLGGGLNLTRTWNSLWPATQAASSVGIFGPNWRSTYEERVFVGSDYYIKYSRSDGSYWSFGVGGPGHMLAAPANVYATLALGSNSWVVTFQSGEQRQFNPTTGLLTAIIDRNGNATQLSYDGSNRLTTVTSPVSQHLYFNYGTGTTANLVTSVTSDFGVTLSYGYDTQGRLTQVTEPDLTILSFTYNTQSEITAVTDNNGKILESHTYDSSGRGLSSSRANGVESLTITYP